MEVLGIAAVIVAVLFLAIAGFLFFRISQEKNNINELKVKIREEILEKDRKIQNLEQKEQEILTNFEKIKQKKMEEMNAVLFKRSEDIQSSLNEMRLKQEKQIEIELQEKKAKSLELYLAELQKEKSKLTASHQEDVKKIQEELDSLRSLENAARMARIRDMNEKNEENWHRIIFSKEDMEELSELNEIKLRNPLPLKKAIYDIYYREPVRDLLNRILGDDKPSGIYKITNIVTKQAYIGKSVDIHRRWQEHIKRGMGAENPTQSIVYDALKEYGISNFTFEVVEVVDAGKLNERESYWIEYFGTKTFGYNMRG